MSTKIYTRKFFSENGSVGGKVRKTRLTPQRRKAIAKKAGKARWAKA